MVEVNNESTNIKSVVDMIMMIFFNSIQGYEPIDYQLILLNTLHEILKRNNRFAESLSEEECEELLRLVKVTASSQKEEKISYYKELADSNNIIALYLLGNMYLYGIWVKQDITMALMCFRKVLCHEKCLEVSYIRGKIINFISNIRYFVKYPDKTVFDVDTEDEDVRLGCELLKKRETAKDTRKGLHHLISAAKRKNYEAFYLLGCTYRIIYNNGIRVDNAINALKIAGNHGIDSAFFELGNLYVKSSRVKHDYGLAKDYYTKAANSGNGLAEFALGNLYSSGLLEENDYSKSIDMYIKASRRNLINTDGLLARLSFVRGGLDGINGIVPDFDEIIKYMIEEYSNHNSKINALLGRLYLRGMYVPCDYEKARDYLERAGAEGEFSAICDLGYMYLMGLGVETNIKKANIYFADANELLSDSKISK